MSSVALNVLHAGYRQSTGTSGGRFRSQAWKIRLRFGQESTQMTISLEQAAINLATAVAVGALIGFERQWRNRLAGLRTNTLVSLGAASFVVFAALVPGDASPTRVAAQVVSGIGFLGAGIIFREGFNVRGLNTAATLWCSAAVGLLAGTGFPAHALVATGFVVFVNLLLRPIVKFIDRQPLVATEVDVGYLVSATCRSPEEAHIRALLLQGLLGSGLALRRLDSVDIDETDKVKVSAHLTTTQRIDPVVEKIVGRLSLEPSVSAARWQADDSVDAEEASSFNVAE